MNRKLLLVIILLASSIGLAYAINQFIITLRLSQTPYEIITPDGSTTIDIPKANELSFNTTIGIRVTNNRIANLTLKIKVKYINIIPHYWNDTMDFLTSAMGFADSQGNQIYKTYIAWHDNQTDTWDYYLELNNPNPNETYWIWFNTPEMTLGENPQIQFTIETTKYIEKS